MRSLSKVDTYRLIEIIQDKKHHSKVEVNQAMSHLSKDYEGLVKKIATTYLSKRKDVTDLTDLLSAGWYGFFRAVSSFDTRHKSKAQLVTYAYKGIQSEVLGAYRRQVAIREVEANTFTEMTAHGSDSDSFDDSDVQGVSVGNGDSDDIANIAHYEMEGQFMSLENGYTFIESLRLNEQLSIAGSLLLFTTKGLETEQVASRAVAKQFGITNEAAHLENANLILTSTQYNGKKYTK